MEREIGKEVRAFVQFDSLETKLIFKTIIQGKCFRNKIFLKKVWIYIPKDYTKRCLGGGSVV